MWLVFKYLSTAAIVVIISEIAKRSDRLGALISALPTVTLLALIWMYIEGQGSEKLSNHAFFTFWYVIPSLPMFLLFPYLISKYSFWLTLFICCLISIVSFALTTGLAKIWSINLM